MTSLAVNLAKYSENALDFYHLINDRSGAGEGHHLYATFQLTTALV
jgi:hypothetical protein